MQKLTQSSNSEVNVDISKAETLECKKCNNNVFLLTYIIKRISPIMSPTGQEAVVPVQVYSCGSCGEIMEIYKNLVETEDADL
jgi:DNA-directed RNA polymerase subunit RPC12/RpoP|tara:strand:- start:12515 stop:12763 length:249 start_codon:yes stop_codon:yes gene_type:complete